MGYVNVCRALVESSPEGASTRDNVSLAATACFFGFRLLKTIL